MKSKEQKEPSKRQVERAATVRRLRELEPEDAQSSVGGAGRRDKPSATRPSLPPPPDYTFGHGTTTQVGQPHALQAVRQR